MERFHLRTGSAAYTFATIKPRVAAMEVVTITGIDTSRGALQVVRGRHGTAPIRFDQGAHLWALPGATTITNSTFTDNAVLPHFYLPGGGDSNTSATVYHPEQAVLRSVVTDFAPATVVENSTFTDNASYGDVASISSTRMSMFAGDNPVRYAAFDYRFHDLDTEEFETGPLDWSKHDPITVAAPFAANPTGIVIENSVLSGASIHNAQLGLETGDIGELPESQRHQNFVRAVTPSERLRPRPVNRLFETTEQDPPPDDEPAPLVELTTLQTPWIYNPSDVPNGNNVPNLGMLILDADDHLLDTTFAYVGQAQAISEGLFGDALSFEDATTNSEATWNFDDLPAGTYELAISVETGAPLGFPIELKNTSTGDVLKDLIFDARTRALSTVDVGDTSITLSDEFRPGLRILIGSEELWVTAAQDNSNGTITYQIATGCQWHSTANPCCWLRTDRLESYVLRSAHRPDLADP